MNHNHIQSKFQQFAFAMLVCGLTVPVFAENVVPLYSFTNGVDGAGPWAGLVEASDDNLYGTTTRGGTHGTGTVFRITKSGEFTHLYSFTGGVFEFSAPLHQSPAAFFCLNLPNPSASSGYIIRNNRVHGTDRIPTWMCTTWRWGHGAGHLR
jgi:uncharacterized repeat protein (TIGR03803 family)